MWLTKKLMAYTAGCCSLKAQFIPVGIPVGRMVASITTAYCFKCGLLKN